VLDGDGGLNATPWQLYPRESAAVFLVQEAGWAPGYFYTDEKKRKYVAPKGVCTLNHPVRGPSTSYDIPVRNTIRNQR
jgi:hypothetical protein